MGQIHTPNKKGFTLAELLIVVGIIAVLVGIAIPVFRNKAEKAKEAYDIHTMRQAASAAIDLYYAGLSVNNEDSASKIGLLWNKGSANECNAYGIYDPATGGFIASMSGDYISVHHGKPYGKGTKINGGTEYTMGDDRKCYVANLDYTDAVVMVAIYPLGNNKHVDVYWKNVRGNGFKDYVGSWDGNRNNPKYSIRIPLG